jgi:hypothetical protein
MAVAAITPRVRTIVVFDEVSASSTEQGVFTLEGVRLHFYAESFPHRTPLKLYLLLSSARKGTYAGRVLIVNERNERTIRYVKFAPTFEQENELLVFILDLLVCEFPEAGQYRIEIHFSARSAGETLKGEHTFSVLTYEE